MSRKRKRGKPHSNREAHADVRQPGLPPGSIEVPPDSPPPQVHVFSYGPDSVSECAIEDVAAIQELRGRDHVLWVNVNGLGDSAVLEQLAAIFDLHPLAMEDVAHVGQRPKVEVYPHHLFCVMKLQRWDKGDLALDSEQLSLFLGDGFVISFQEHVGDPFDTVRARIRRGRPVIRGGGADFLAYALMDAIVDHFFPMMEGFGDLLDELEVRVMDEPTQDTLRSIRHARRVLIGIRRAVWPMRDAVATIQSDTTPYFTPYTRPYLRDLFDHSLRIVDIAESYRDQVSGLMDGYVSSVSFRMNEIMGLLTLVGTIFLPLSFLTGLYGMNFDTSSPYNMPELGFRFGYPVIVGLMLGLAIAMLFYFRRSGWFAVTGVGVRHRMGDDPDE